MPLGSIHRAMIEREGLRNQPGPVVSYANLRQPLPNPPKGEHWVRDAATSEWRLEADEADRPNESVERMGVTSNDEHDEFIEHLIQPHDTFQGLCLRYKLTPSQLRKAGGFSGENLKFATNPLRIRAGGQRHVLQEQNFTKEEKITSILRSCPRLAMTEARCYLDLNDWDISAAKQNAREDGF